MTEPRVPPRIWIGLVAVAIYVALAAGVAELITSTISLQDPLGEFLLGHLVVLIPLVVAGLWFVRWAGWTREVWRTPAAWEVRPRSWWMLAFPALLLIQSAVTLSTSDWSRWQATSVLLVALVCLLVGLGEELYFRGILRVSIRHRHVETLALVVTSVAFGLAHSFSAMFHGEPFGAVVFQVMVTALAGAVYYGAFLATGRLWVVVVLHALDDFSLHINGADLTLHPLADSPANPATITTQAALWLLTLVLLISCIRRDRQAHRPAG